MITFNPCGGDVFPSTIIRKHGPDYGELPVPIRSGYSFEGWWTEENVAGIHITSESKVKPKSDHILYARWKSINPNIIKGTAAIGNKSIRFNIVLPVHTYTKSILFETEPNGFIVDEICTYNLEVLSYDTSSGNIEGETEIINGISYLFSGIYSNENGLIGEIERNENDYTQSGAISGVAVFADNKVISYFGIGYFSEISDNLPVTTWNMTIDFSTNRIIGTWCERSLQSNNTVYAYGTASGTLSGNQVFGKAFPLPEYSEQMYHLDIDWAGEISSDYQVLSGTWINHYDLGIAEGTFLGTRVPE